MLKPFQWLHISPCLRFQSLDQVLVPHHIAGTLASFLFQIHTKQVPIFQSTVGAVSSAWRRFLHIHPWLIPSLSLHLCPNICCTKGAVSDYQPAEKEYTHPFFHYYLPPYTSLLLFCGTYTTTGRMYIFCPFISLEYKIFESKNLVSFFHCRNFSITAVPGTE